jgi:hypothetical protein
MLQAIINRAQRSIDTLVAKYVTRAAVAVPFVIALGFGTAAATVKLVELYGSMTAYAVVAAMFGGVGMLAAAAIALSGPNPTVAVATGVAEESTTGSEQEMAPQSSADPELLLTAIGAIGPAAFPVLLRTIFRNLPLVLGVLVLAYLLLAETKASDVAVDPDPV